MCGDAAQQSLELGPVGLIERGENFVLDRIGLDLGGCEQRASAIGQMDRVRAAVGRVWSALDQSPFFQFIDEPDHGVAVNMQKVGEFLLAAPVGGGEMVEDPEVCGVESERGKPRREPARDVMADLGQQEHPSIVQQLIRHASTVAS